VQYKESIKNVKQQKLAKQETTGEKGFQIKEKIKMKKNSKSYAKKRTMFFTRS